MNLFCIWFNSAAQSTNETTVVGVAESKSKWNHQAPTQHYPLSFRPYSLYNNRKVLPQWQQTQHGGTETPDWYLQCRCNTANKLKWSQRLRALSTINQHCYGYLNIIETFIISLQICFWIDRVPLDGGSEANGERPSDREEILRKTTSQSRSFDWIMVTLWLVEESGTVRQCVCCRALNSSYLRRKKNLMLLCSDLNFFLTEDVSQLS